MKNTILAFVLAATIASTLGDSTMVHSALEDPWNYDSEKAPYNVDLLGAYNGKEIKYYKIARRDSGFEWEFMENYEAGSFAVGKAPDAWIVLPKPKLPKLVEGYTKEQVQQMLKEFER